MSRCNSAEAIRRRDIQRSGIQQAILVGYFASCCIERDAARCSQQRIAGQGDVAAFTAGADDDRSSGSGNRHVQKDTCLDEAIADLTQQGVPGCDGYLVQRSNKPAKGNITCSPECNAVS